MPLITAEQIKDVCAKATLGEWGKEAEARSKRGCLIYVDTNRTGRVKKNELNTSWNATSRHTTYSITLFLISDCPLCFYSFLFPHVFLFVSALLESYFKLSGMAFFLGVFWYDGKTKRIQRAPYHKLYAYKGTSWKKFAICYCYDRYNPSILCLGYLIRFVHCFYFICHIF